MKKNVETRLHFAFAIALCFYMLYAAIVRGQQIPMASRMIDGGKVNAKLWNGSDAFWDLMCRPAYEVPKGSGKHSAFAGSLLIGGLAPSGQLHVAGQTYRQSGYDFYAGPYRDGVAYDMPRKVDFFESPNCNKGVAVPDGRIAFLTETGFEIVFPATGASIPLATAFWREDSDPVYSDGKVYGVFRQNPSLSSTQYLVAWDTSMYLCSVVCTLSAKTHEPSLTALSTGSILIADTVLQVWNPGASTTTLIGGTASHVGSCALRFPGDNVLVIGGNSAATTWYHHGTGTTSAGPAMAFAKKRPALTPLPSGGWIVGGSDIDPETEILNAAGTAFSIGPSFVSPMGDVAAVTTPGGRVVFADDRMIQTLDPGASAFKLLELPFSFLGPNAFITHMEGPWHLVHFGDYVYYNFDDERIEKGKYQHIWKVTQDEVDEFIADFAGGTVDFTHYPDIETWPGNGEWWNGEDYHLAPFVDVNGDGLYKPAVHGDYPCITGEQMLWHVYHDDGVHSESGGVPMQVQVEQSSYIFRQSLTTCTDTFLDYSTFYHVEISNHSAINYHDVYVGYYLDGDLGNPFDDYVGSDTTRNIGFTYNGDANDEGSTGYGLTPPAIGIQVLGAPGGDNLDHFMAMENNFSFHGIPETPLHYYGYLQSRWKDASLADEGCGSGIPSDAMFPGDAGWCGGTPSGCSELTAGSMPFDRRMVMGIGPIDLDAGETIELDYAILWAQANSPGNLESVCRLLDASDNISAWWKAQTFSCFDLAIAKDDPVVSMLDMQLFPNPNRGAFTLQFGEPLRQDAVVTVLDMLGRELMSLPAGRGQSEMQLDMALKPGMYLVSMHSGEASVTERMIVE